MVQDRRDHRTQDLLEWQPPAVTQRFPEEKVRAGSLRARMAKAVSCALKECGRPREEVARRMSEFLGEEVTKHVLDAYASEAREDHSISAVRLIALVHATGDMRLLQELAEPFRHAVVEDRYVSAIRAIKLREKTRELERLAEIEERRAWGGGR